MADFSTKFVSEMLAMMVVITIGDGVIANEVLLRTKGHGLGLGHVSVAFGMAFFTAIIMFGHISATVNPAMLLAEACVGLKSWKDALRLMIADFIGAFLGAIIVYAVYMAHFSLLPPRPYKPRWNDTFVRPTPPSNTRAAFISYEAGSVGSERQAAALRRRRRQVGQTGTELQSLLERPPLVRANSIQAATLMHAHDEGLFSGADPPTAERRSFSFNPAMHASSEGGTAVVRDEDNIEKALAPAFGDVPAADDTSGHPNGYNSSNGQQQQEQHQHNTLIHRLLRALKAAWEPTWQVDVPQGRVTAAADRAAEAAIQRVLATTAAAAAGGGAAGGSNGTAAASSNGTDCKPSITDGLDGEELAAYRGAILADQNAKLSVFCSRPAVYAPLLNFLCEVIGTFVLIWSALMLLERIKLLPTKEMAEGAEFIMPLMIGFLVVGLVMSLGGPTGYAANPARDFGPRCAHFVLPIPNKGCSEWYYAPIPFFATFVGGFFGGVAFYLCRRMNTYPDWYTGPDPWARFGGHWDCAGQCP